MNQTADTPILQVRDLSVSFGRNAPAVRGVSFEIAKGETLAIVGESGSGKSVTALSTVRLLPYPLAHHGEASSVTWKGEELMGADERTLMRIRGNEIAMIFQEPMTSLNPLHTVEKQIGEILELHKGLKGDAARARILELLDLVGIKDPESRLPSYPHQLSGGQRQRVMIAMALANEPDLLIADEPTTALDVTIQAQILALLDRLRRELGMAVLLITHDLGIVRKVADRVCVMTDGEIVEHGTAERVFTDPQHPYTRKLLAAEPKGAPEPVAERAKTVLQASDVRVWFPIQRGFLKRTVGHVKAVDGVTVGVKQGETVGIVGESGSGKTTLAMAILRLTACTGRITFLGREVQGMGKRELRALRRDMQIVFQDPYGSLSPRLSIAEIVGEGMGVHDLSELGLKSEEDRDRRIDEVLREVGLDPALRDRYPHEFSGGQRQRISIARAMVLRPKLVVLDEPTSALDMSVQAQIVELLRDLQEKHGLAYLFISHDLKVVRAMSHRVYVMRDGKVVEHGPTDQVMDAPKRDYTKALMAAAFELEAHEDGAVRT
ncbi:ABC transporter ATP-binding protein [Thalassobaculum litoreum]|uniref:Microcin C transport system ATP-binding protein n=1 Tax=Thalassobaculum litoreum DSM 18839 TaxID=1123362 RepID=A0A8G2EWA8_9PROT|nr:ABC transporter ATP-binding protein [Thalassobaculum litoreum]SDG21004.1 microcin C transport system ATP-binding protein [Thalassobaculum litoreum DSM 18839]